MLPYEAVTNELIPQNLMDQLLKGVPPTAFVDDTCYPMKIPKSRAACQQFQAVLQDLEHVTGLKVNQSKSEVLLLEDNPTDAEGLQSGNRPG